MKRSITAVAAAGLLTFGLAACGEEEPETETPDTPAATEEQETEDPATDEATEEPTTEEATTEEMTTEEPTTEDTAAPGMDEETTDPGMGEDTAAPEGDAAEWCMGLAELGSGGFDPSVFTEDPDQAIQLLEDLREGAPGPVADNLDVMIENLDAALAGDLENVDQAALQEATSEFQTNVVDACSGAM